jgi:Tol biopolymer transport system component
MGGRESARPLAVVSMPKPFKPYVRWLLTAAGVVMLAAPALILISRSEPAPRDAAPTSASVSESPPAEPEKALVAPGDMPPLVFASNRPGNYQLFATEPAGGDPVQVTDELSMYPSWSPGGTWLVFVGESPGLTSRRLELSRIQPDATIDSLLSGPQVPSHPTVNAADETVAYQSTLQEISGAAGVTGLSNIDSVDLGDGRQRTVLKNRGAAYQPAWSPDGRRLAVVLGNTGCKSKRLCRQRLAVWDPEKDVRRTLIDRGSAAAPAWSPDGKSIAFTWDRGEGPAVWIVRVGDGALEQVTSGRADAEPTWSPDGDRLAFMRRCDIFVQRIGEQRATNVTDSRGTCEISPAWRPEA